MNRQHLVQYFGRPKNGQPWPGAPSTYLYCPLTYQVQDEAEANWIEATGEHAARMQTSPPQMHHQKPPCPHTIPVKVAMQHESVWAHNLTFSWQGGVGLDTPTNHNPCFICQVYDREREYDSSRLEATISSHLQLDQNNQQPWLPLYTLLDQESGFFIKCYLQVAEPDVVKSPTNASNPQVIRRCCPTHRVIFRALCAGALFDSTAI